MQFIRVSADPCNQDGVVLPQTQHQRVEINLNINLISGIIGNNVLIGNSKVTNIGGTFYKNIRLANGVVIP